MTTLCLNPGCSAPENGDQAHHCHHCGSPLLIGDRYQPIALLGEGGFGRTFQARDRQQPNTPDCVIKQLLPTGGTAPWRGVAAPLKRSSVHSPKDWPQRFEPQRFEPQRFEPQRFEQEAQQLQALGTHPQIPQLLDYGKHGHGKHAHSYYLVQTFIPGPTLAQQVMAQGPLPEPAIRQLLHQLLPVLAFIHEAQVIHRDLKPANIIWDPSQRHYVLVDFGASKTLAADGWEKTGTVIGSAGYVAPEQALGKATFASDLYSLGVTCLHAMTGLHPFDLYSVGEDRWVWRPYIGQYAGPDIGPDAGQANLQSHSPRSQAQGVSQSLGQILDRLVSRPLRLRYQRTEQVLADLQLAAIPDKITVPQSPVRLPFQGGNLAMGSRPLPRLTAQAIQTLTQPRHSIVLALALSPDGRALATGSSDQGVRLWDWATGDCLQCFRPQLGLGAGHRDQVTCVTFSPDGRRLYSGSLDGTVKVWDLQTYRQIASLHHAGWGTTAIALSPDEHILVSGGTEGKITLWRDMLAHAQPQPLATLVQHQHRITALAVHPQGDRLVSSSQDGSIRLWQLPGGRLLHTWNTLAHPITGLSLAPDGATLVAGSSAGMISQWPLGQSSRHRTLKAHKDAITAIAFSPNGKFLASGSVENQLKLWHLATGTQCLTLNHAWGITAIAFTPDGTHLVSSSRDETVKIWQLQRD